MGKNRAPFFIEGNLILKDRRVMIQRKTTISFLFVLYLLFFQGSLSFSLAQEKTPTNSLGMEFVPIPSGFFSMGCAPKLENCHDNETPQHVITISEPFYLGKYEVTQEQWEKIMGENPSRFKKRTNPVENVSWDDIQIFIRKLNLREGSGQYRLPTEAEWEYAARAGSSTVYSFGNNPGLLATHAWYMENSKESTHPVGEKSPNAWGLHDMYGNVWEWVSDRYGDYPKSSMDPQGPSHGNGRVIRGGSWYSSERLCRSAVRHEVQPRSRNDDLGFRLAFFPKK